MHYPYNGNDQVNVYDLKIGDTYEDACYLCGSTGAEVSIYSMMVTYTIVDIHECQNGCCRIIHLKGAECPHCTRDFEVEMNLTSNPKALAYMEEMKKQQQTIRQAQHRAMCN